MQQGPYGFPHNGGINFFLVRLGWSNKFNHLRNRLSSVVSNKGLICKLCLTWLWRESTVFFGWLVGGIRTGHPHPGSRLFPVERRRQEAGPPPRVVVHGGGHPAESLVGLGGGQGGLDAVVVVAGEVLVAVRDPAGVILEQLRGEARLGLSHPEA